MPTDTKRHLITPLKQPKMNIQEYNRWIKYKTKSLRMQKLLIKLGDVMRANMINEAGNRPGYIFGSKGSA